MSARRSRELLGHCEDARLRASLDLDGELDELGRFHLRRHLDVCRPCGDWVEAMSALTTLLRTAAVDPPPTEEIPRPAASAAVRPVSRPEAGQSPRNIPSRKRHPCMPPPKPAASPAA